MGPRAGGAGGDRERRARRQPLSRRRLLGAAHARSPSGTASAFEQVVVGNGADGVLNYLALALLEPGDEVAFCWPSFPVYPINAAKMGAVAVRAPLAGSSYDLEALAGCDQRAHEDRVRHESQQPDRRHGRARGARALPRRAARSTCCRCSTRPTSSTSTIPSIPTARASSSRAGAAASCCARSRRSTGWRASASATGSARPTSPAACLKVKNAFDVTQSALDAALASLGAGDEVARRRDETRAGRERLAAGLRERGLRAARGRRQLPLRRRGRRRRRSPRGWSARA